MNLILRDYFGFIWLLKETFLRAETVETGDCCSITMEYIGIRQFFGNADIWISSKSYSGRINFRMLRFLGGNFSSDIYFGIMDHGKLFTFIQKSNDYVYLNLMYRVLCWMCVIFYYYLSDNNSSVNNWEGCRYNSKWKNLRELWTHLFYWGAVKSQAALEVSYCTDSRGGLPHMALPGPIIHLENM